MRRAIAIDQFAPEFVGISLREKAEGWPVVVAPLAFGLALILVRMTAGSEGILTQHALVILALVGLVSASVFLVGNVLFADCVTAGQALER